MPPRPVLITFDDGHRSVLERAAPALIDRGIPALVFVVAGHLDTDTPFWWDQVAEAVAHGARAASIDLPRSPQAAVRHLKSVPDAQRRYVVNELARQHPLREMNLTAREVQQMHVAGIGIGSHSYTHPILDMCTSDTIAHEVEQSRTLLTDVLGGTAPSCFAYPNGDRDQRVRLAVERANYEVAFTFDHRLQPLDPPSAPLEISRVRVDADDDPARLRAVLSGVEPLLLHRLGRVSDRSSSRRD